MLSSGQLLAERYKLTHRIAVGGMGEVWQASDTRLDRTVAVKVLKAELSGDPEFLHRFRTEARMTASLNHPGIAAVHDYGETVANELSIAYLVMELVEGDPLAGILAREGRLSAERTLDILEQAGRGLQAAHERGLVHRDVKPGNILVTPAGQVKITDFGIAKAADAAPVTRSGMVMGTAHYIAPEQALGHNAEPASDVYSLAVCGYECLVGHRPFLSENAVTVAMMHIRDVAPPLPPDVPHAARMVIEATLIKDPRQRYNSGGEFANAVAAVRAGHPLPTPSGLVNAAYAAGHGQQPVATQHGQPIGPASHPVLRPVPPPVPHLVTGVASLRPRRRAQWGWWVLLAVILVAVVVAGTLVIVKLVRPSNAPSPGNVETSEPAPGRQPLGNNTPDQVRPTIGRPAEPGSATGASLQRTMRGSSEQAGSPGMMDTPWTEWNGTQR
ncbi:serine/threonine-protein kinase [Amycolatopsis sp. H20-H5]|uniref:serine/threonine-protein kinase n=1 Tax=Amycolatopsis sp. H20-H5 TaxID=3046309 RepID=UPI002DB7C6E6|nr:serine/threonine-protein kinase [Amycolatopsis sp. H20-H5]MEC3974538.1 serine/threonine-protein kinase [Amycolatopsis sp. H20-H5]